MKVALIVLLGVVASLAAPSDKLSGRIVGGEEASNGQFPYKISLRYAGYHLCGGSILDNTTILSSAACVFGHSVSLMNVVVGTNKLNEGGKEHQVKNFVVNKDYVNWEFTNDISLINLATPIQFNEKVQPIELRTEYMPGGEECILSGWGYTTEDGWSPNQLQFIKLNTLSNEDCIEKQHAPNREVIESEGCTLTKTGEGACYGDSGGPLVDSEGKQFGIASWRVPCARGEPDVYTRISSFLDWIEENRN